VNKRYLALLVLLIHPVISYIFSDICTINTGFSFGMFSSLGSELSLIINFSALFITTVVLFNIVGVKGRAWLLMLIFASVINLVDRIVHAGVCDYIQLHQNLPVFNINDAVILYSVFNIGRLLLDGND
jgi:lipoprotein signal peptidase